MTEVGAYPCLKHLRYPQFRNRSVFHTDKAREHLSCLKCVQCNSVNNTLKQRCIFNSQQLHLAEEHLSMLLSGGDSRQGSCWRKVVPSWKIASAEKSLYLFFCKLISFDVGGFFFLLQKAVKLQRKPYHTMFCMHFRFKMESSHIWLQLEKCPWGSSPSPAHCDCWFDLQVLPVVRGSHCMGNCWCWFIPVFS